MKIESCNQVEDGLSEDCASNECGANYCFCTECEKGYKLRMSECTGTTALADACVVDGDFTQSPREHITCEPEIGCEVLHIYIYIYIYISICSIYIAANSAMFH